jgi:hypothetical protein
MRGLVAGVAAAIMLSAPAANAQDAAKPAEQTAAPEPYQPDLGDFMALQQMRHIKIWFAGSVGNWPLADYEIHELEEGFDDVTKLLGGDIVDQNVAAPITALRKAVDDKSQSAFFTAFDQLNAGCNACHNTLGHGFIVIQRPTVLPYTDQAFAPQK